MSEPSIGIVIAIKVLAIYFILGGFYAIGSDIYLLVVSRPKLLAEYPQSVPDINALFVLKYFLGAILSAWPFILGIGSFRMFRWSRICILWLLYIQLFSAIWDNSLLFYWYLGGRTSHVPFYIGSWLLIISSILVPLLFIVFYSNVKVKVAFESKDRCIRWNDKYPSLLWLINIVVGLIAVLLELGKF